MKAKFSILLMLALALVLVFGLVFVSCDSATPKFEGRWLRDFAINHPTYTDYSFTFSGNTFDFIMAEGGSPLVISGTFTYTDDVISFNGGANGSWRSGYSLGPNSLTLASGPSMYSFIAGTYIKQ